MASDTVRPCRFPRHLSAVQARQLLTTWLKAVLPTDPAVKEQLGSLILQLAAQRGSFQAVARRAEWLPSLSLLGKKWRAWRLSRTISQWEVELAACLRVPWEAVLAGERVWLVADWHAVPYWGAVTPALAPWVRRGPPQSGTTRFLVYASVAVLWRGIRIQVAFTQVAAQESQAQVFTRLVERVATLRLRPLGWLMDKGFYAAGVVAGLREQSQPYLIAAPRRGAKNGIAALLNELEANDGFQAEEPPSLTQEYTLSSGDPRVPDQPTTVIVTWQAVRAPKEPEPAPEPKKGGKRKRKRPAPRRQRTLRRSKTQPGQKWRALAWIGGGRPWTGKKAQRAYAPRTGFESGYRLSKGSRGRTSSRDPGWRLLLFGLSLLLQNAWIWLVIGGQRTLHRCWKRLRDYLPFIDFCGWIVRVLERETGHRLGVDLPGV